MAKGKYTADDCIELLRAKSAELAASGCARLPQRGDFSGEEVVAVKAFLGPWPRALEAAGLKEPRPDDRQQRNREKRTRAKRRRTARLKSEKQTALNAPDTGEGGDPGDSAGDGGPKA